MALEDVLGDFGRVKLHVSSRIKIFRKNVGEIKCAAAAFSDLAELGFLYIDDPLVNQLVHGDRHRLYHELVPAPFGLLQNLLRERTS